MSLTPSQLAAHHARKARLERFAHAATVYEQSKFVQRATMTFPVIRVRREYESRKRPAVYQPMHQRIVEIVAFEFGIAPKQLTGVLRTQPYTTARFVAVGLFVEMTQMSLPAIGRRLGNRDHTTILHARERAKQLFADEAFRNRIEQMKAEILR